MIAKTCPFCRATPIIHNELGYYRVFCRCELHPCTGLYAERDNAIKVWNRRPNTEIKLFLRIMGCKNEG